MCLLSSKSFPNFYDMIVKTEGAINHYDLNLIFKNSVGKAMHLNPVEGYGCHQKKLHALSPAFRIPTDATERTASLKSFMNTKEWGIHEFPEPPSRRTYQDRYLLQLPLISYTSSYDLGVSAIDRGEKYYSKVLQKQYKGKDPKLILGKRRRVMIDLPLPKAAESRSLEGIYPKWPNFPKIVLWRPKGGKSGKPKQNNKHTAPCRPCLRITQPLLPAKCTLPRHGRTPRPASGAPPRTPTHLPRPGSVSASTCCSARQRYGTPAAEPPQIQPHPGQRLPLPCSGSARGSNALAPR